MRKRNGVFGRTLTGVFLRPDIVAQMADALVSLGLWIAIGGKLEDRIKNKQVKKEIAWTILGLSYCRDPPTGKIGAVGGEGEWRAIPNPPASRWERNQSEPHPIENAISPCRNAYSDACESRAERFPTPKQVNGELHPISSSWWHREMLATVATDR